MNTPSHYLDPNRNKGANGIRKGLLILILPLALSAGPVAFVGCTTTETHEPGLRQPTTPGQQEGQAPQQQQQAPQQDGW